MHVDDVRKTIETVKGLVDDYEEALKHSREKTDKINELNKQLKDKYSTDTHILMTKDAVVALADKFDELSGEFNSLDGLLDDISSYADSIHDDTSYNDASRYGDWASGYAEEIRELLKVETEEVT